ncbi:hypothetical protein NKR19_g9913 [Coniochaeta hoffmannii]|uniref:Uncharacterized protein n=1 Tax=Coniochaeta hoffmannii TaxID=91930 RepID=A0AA38R2H7_9PEZI|nr:hypothetical protein NKR19_g9913 [Coniochaeta hoffmannii]
MYILALLTLAAVSLAAPNPKPQVHQASTTPAPSAPSGADVPRPFTLLTASTPATVTVTNIETRLSTQTKLVTVATVVTELLTLTVPATTVTEVEQGGVPSEGPWLYWPDPQYEPGQPIVTVVDGATVTWYPAPKDKPASQRQQIVAESVTLTISAFSTSVVAVIAVTVVAPPALSLPNSARAAADGGFPPEGPWIWPPEPHVETGQPITPVVDGKTVVWYPAAEATAQPAPTEAPEKRYATIVYTITRTGPVQTITQTIRAHAREPRNDGGFWG